MATKEQSSLAIPETNGIIQLDPWIEIEKSTLGIVVAGAFGRRNSEEVRSLRIGLGTKLTGLGMSLKKSCLDPGAQDNQKVEETDSKVKKSSIALGKVIHRRELLKDAQEHWEKGRVGGFDVKEMRDVAEASLNELLDAVKKEK